MDEINFEGYILINNVKAHFADGTPYWTGDPLYEVYKGIDFKVDGDGLLYYNDKPAAHNLMDAEWA